MTQISRALISVADKTGVAALARGLHQQGIEILSTGGTAKALRDEKIPVRDVSEVTGFPEIMDGRVKTLHPKIHGGLLGRGELDQAVMREHDIAPIGLVVVNLYPFEQTVARADCTRADAIENIDIGGPAMLRAAAKNHEHVAVVVDPADYAAVIDELQAHDRTVQTATRRRLAAKAFALTATYDGAIYDYLHRTDGGEMLPARLPLALTRQLELRYGENPHQSAALYRLPDAGRNNLITAHLHQGKALSYNNIADADAAVECVRTLPAPACVIVKHANPCGAATAASAAAAYDQAYATDPTSAFGGIIAFNVPVDGSLASEILGRQFVEVMVAPGFDAGALEALATKPNVRVLETGKLGAPRASRRVQQIEGGILIQDADIAEIGVDDLKVVTDRQPNKAELQDALLAWKICRFVKSNAIVYCSGGTTLGVGAGQMSRVVSARIAAEKAAEAGLSLTGAVMASDAFFPFRDGLDIAAQYGIRTVIQPGGSMRDDEVIAAANEHGIAMLFTGMRHFRH